MEIEFDKSFEKSLDNISDKSVLNKVVQLIEIAEKAGTVSELPNVKKLSGFKSYYRARIGDYRIGFEKIDSGKIRFIIIAHRKNIYKKYP